MKKITFTFDLEEHRPDRKGDARYPFITEKVLEFLAEKSIQGTFFIVGNIAKTQPELVKQIANQGHEIAFHSMHHKQLTDETPKSFAADIQAGKTLLEDLTGQAIEGYRAPVFSLTPKTIWAVDILKESGFTYSSSVLPAKSPLHGFPGTPKQPFKWANGLIEIPVPIASFLGFKMPFLGGFYLRYLPIIIINQLTRPETNQALWTYVHPYDFDDHEDFGKIAGASLPVSILLWFNRKNTFQKLEKIVDNNAGSFAAQLHNKVFEGLPVFSESSF